MKFLSSLFCAMVLSIVFILSLGLIFKCDHENMGRVFDFQPENSTALNYVKSKCYDCEKGFHTTLFRDAPPDDEYIDVIKEHCKDKTFISGEYDTITATVMFPDYDAIETKIQCYVQQGNTKVCFPVEFNGEYEDEVSLLQEGDEITFYGKSSDTGLSWTDCELIAE